MGTELIIIIMIVTGKSTHNQRIERLWRDVSEGCLRLFYQLFWHLKTCQLLDPDNEVHLCCLHYVYIPMINKHLSIWKDDWVHHPLRTEHNKSPMQLWVQGLLTAELGHAMMQTQEPVTEVCRIYLTVPLHKDWKLGCKKFFFTICFQFSFHCGLQEDINQYGIDWEGPSRAEDDNHVKVPKTTDPLTADNFLQLTQRIDPMLDDESYGIEL